MEVRALLGHLAYTLRRTSVYYNTPHHIFHRPQTPDPRPQTPDPSFSRCGTPSNPYVLLFFLCEPQQPKQLYCETHERQLKLRTAPCSLHLPRVSAAKQVTDSIIGIPRSFRHVSSSFLLPGAVTSNICQCLFPFETIFLDQSS